MRAALALRAAHARTPMIKFLGKRTLPKKIDHTPQPHPASPTHELPENFASYRSKAQQHGPLKGQQQQQSTRQGNSSSQPKPTSGSVAGGPMTYGHIGGKSGHDLGSIKPKDGEYFDISELPKRFQRRTWTEQEMDATISGGASMW